VISSLFYEGRLKNGRTRKSDRSGVVVLNTSKDHPVIEKDATMTKGFNAWNPKHADKIVAFVAKELIGHLGIKEREIGVMVPLRYAAERLRDVFRAKGLPQIEVGTVHTFQGREKDCIIFDTVMAGVSYTIRPFDEMKRSKDEPPRLSEIRRLLNVALTRSKDFLCVVADLDHFQKHYKDRFILEALSSLEPIAVDMDAVERPPSQPATLTADSQADLLRRYLPAGAHASSTPLHGPSVTPEAHTQRTTPAEVADANSTGADSPLSLAPSDAPKANRAKPDHGGDRPPAAAISPPAAAISPPAGSPVGDSDDRADHVDEGLASSDALAAVKPDKHAAKDVDRYGTQINSLRSEINRLHAKLRGPPAFRPSVEGEHITGQLPKTMVCSESQFKDWIDMMYKHFYEASGGPNAGLPLVDKSHPLSRIRWKINRLRNGFFHDSAHSADPVEAQETQRRIYTELLGKAFPTQPGEWTALQLALMNHTAKWLEHVLAQLRK
jgi:hypothetical protein